VAIIKLHSHS